MVTTTTDYLESRYRAYPGNGYDGVVRVNVGANYGTGTLLLGGRVVLTAAHLYEDNPGATKVHFETASGILTLDAVSHLVHPNYDRLQNNNDLALVWLVEQAPTGVERFELYRARDEINQYFTFVGYGRNGTGDSGLDEGDSTPLRLKAGNRFDTDAASLKEAVGAAMGWLPLAGTQLIADFDDGSIAHDALWQLMKLYEPGLGLDEGFIAGGDSGGPAFINGKIAGIASYTASLNRGSASPDVDHETNSSFGEIAAWQRVSTYQQWIDQSLRVEFPNAPKRPEEVQKLLPEGDSGTSYAYFLLQFSGIRSDPNQTLSVDYVTRDGTAVAGRDYLAVSGQLRLYRNENQAVIPVEIIGDDLAEPKEFFYLDVYNPVGGSFGEGVVKLTAVRTILDDDGWV